MKILEKVEKKKNTQLLGYNIEGNLGLALIQMRRPDGKSIFDAALENVKRLEGEKSYDYACLRMAYSKILRKN